MNVNTLVTIVLICQIFNTFYYWPLSETKKFAGSSARRIGATAQKFFECENGPQREAIIIDKMGTEISDSASNSNTSTQNIYRQNESATYLLSNIKVYNI